MKYIRTTLLILLLSYTFLFGEQATKASINALQIWIEVLIPTLFFPTICLRIFMDYIPLNFLRSSFWNISNSRYIIIGWLLGYPSFAMVLEEECANHTLTNEACNRLLYSISCCSLPFLYITLGIQTFQNWKVGFLLIFCEILSNIFLLYITRTIPLPITDVQYPTHSFFSICKKHLITTGISLFYIGGYILICYVLISFIPKTPFSFILHTLIEFSSGTLLLARVPSLFQLPAIGAVIAFGGFCIHLQTFSSFEHIKIRYFTYLNYRILQAILVFMLIFLLQFLL